MGGGRHRAQPLLLTIRKVSSNMPLILLWGTFGIGRGGADRSKVIGRGAPIPSFKIYIHTPIGGDPSHFRIHHKDRKKLKKPELIHVLILTNFELSFLSVCSTSTLAKDAISFSHTKALLVIPEIQYYWYFLTRRWHRGQRKCHTSCPKKAR